MEKKILVTDLTKNGSPHFSLSSRFPVMKDQWFSFLCLFSFFSLFSLFGWSVVVDGARPELVSSSVWYSNQTVLNVDFDIAVVRMEFDQPLYTNGQTFLCTSVDQSCPPVGCTPCDWSGQQVIFSHLCSFIFFLRLFFRKKIIFFLKISRADVEIHLVVDQLKMGILHLLKLGVIHLFLPMNL